MALSANNQKNYNTISEPEEEEKKPEPETPQTTTTPNHGCRLRWRPTSDEEFEESERKLLAYLNGPFEVNSIDVGEIIEKTGIFCTSKPRKVQIRTLVVNKSRSGTPLVLLHGLGLGIGSYLAIINAISYQGPVYAVDIPGFGRSTRFKFPKNHKEVEQIYVQLLERWRTTLKLEQMNLTGMSFGGFVATAYALQHADRVRHLVLIDPWGFPEKPKRITALVGCKNRFLIGSMILATRVISVFAQYRLLGPFGRRAYCGDDMPVQAWSLQFEAQANEKGCSHILGEYLYHCIAQEPSGETAFRYLMDCIVYAKEPMCRRINNLNVPLIMFYPEDDSFLPGIPSSELKELVGPECKLEVYTIPSTDHATIMFAKEIETTLNGLD